MLLGKIIDCKQISLKIKSEVIEEVQKVKQDNNITPTVVSILVGNDYGSIYYQNMQDKTARELGINFIKANFDKNVTEEELLSCIRKYNDDKLIHGIMVLLPFPGNINEKKVLNAINPNKDIDCLTDICMGRLFKSDKIFYPCTANSVATIIDSLGIELEGKEAVIIGRSNIVGKPTAMMMLDRNTTVTVCHSRTRNLEGIASRADILISAIGKPKYINSNFIKKGAVVIDVGTSSLNGKITGDVDFDDVIDKVSYISTVPGGVGTLTTALLFKNLCEAVKKCI